MKSPTNSSFFVSIEIAGSPKLIVAFIVALIIVALMGCEARFPIRVFAALWCLAIGLKTVVQLAQQVSHDVLAGLECCCSRWISQRDIQRPLTKKQDGFLDETRAVLRAGLATAPWISVDRFDKRADGPEGVSRTDTRARHEAANDSCMQIGNDRFTWCSPRFPQRRMNFLNPLYADHADFVMNNATFAYLRTRALSAQLFARLAMQLQTAFANS